MTEHSVAAMKDRSERFSRIVLALEQYGYTGELKLGGLKLGNAADRKHLLSDAGRAAMAQWADLGKVSIAYFLTSMASEQYGNKDTWRWIHEIGETLVKDALESLRAIDENSSTDWQPRPLEKMNADEQKALQFQLTILQRAVDRYCDPVAPAN